MRHPSRNKAPTACMLSALYAVILTAYGCGGTGFSGSSAKSPTKTPADPEAPPADDPPKTQDANPEAPLAALTWDWPCAASSTPSPATPADSSAPPATSSSPAGADKTSAVSTATSTAVGTMAGATSLSLAPQKPKQLVGSGSFKFKPNQLHETPVTFSGRFCKQQDAPRDIVFIIDVSGSMAQNDPFNGTSCGRLEALQAVIQTVPAGSHFGVVTFHTLVGKQSSSLFDSQAALYADLAGSGSIANVVCAHYLDTNYQSGLRAAGALLQTGRANATKEIYFISDGEPTAGFDGISVAASLKKPGIVSGGTTIPVTIATIMLNGTDQVLEKSIASRDANDKPLHAYVKNSNDLAQNIAKLAANTVVSADIKYRPSGSGQWTTVNATPYIKGDTFAMPPIKLSSTSAPNGIDVIYEYLDQHGGKHSASGRLSWSDTPD